MTNWKWFLVVLTSLASYFTVTKMWNKDLKGAIGIATLVFIIGWMLISISGCTVPREYQPWLEAGVAYDTQKTVGRNPACVVGVVQPIGFGMIPPEWLAIGYHHISSCPDLFDSNTYDAIELMTKIPLGRAK